MLGAGPTADVALGHKQLEYLAEADMDLVVFQQVPLAVRSRILKEGAARAFEGFRHI